MGERVERRLAAVLAADVVGCSRLIGADETGTLARLAALRELLDHEIAQHAGRLFKETGDGYLVEFTSAVQAVTCAMEIQKEVEVKAGEGQPLRLRIGIHVGDVVVQGEDLMGDGVNIAARIEGIAEPGGITITRSVHEQVRAESWLHGQGRDRAKEHPAAGAGLPQGAGQSDLPSAPTREGPMINRRVCAAIGAMALFSTSAAAQVTDGDTLKQGGITYRLWGIEAPESNRFALMDGRLGA